MGKIHLSDKTTQLSKEQTRVTQPTLSHLERSTFLLCLRWTTSSSITNCGNVHYEGKDSLLGRELSGFMKRARNTYCREDASRV